MSVRVWPQGDPSDCGEGFYPTPRPVKDAVVKLSQLSGIRLVTTTEASSWTTGNDRLVLNQTSSLLQQTGKINRSVAESEEGLWLELQNVRRHQC